MIHGRFRAISRLEGGLMRAFSKLGAHLMGQLRPARVKQPSDAVLELPPPRCARSPCSTLLARRQSQREFALEALAPEVRKGVGARTR
jgi:hypothetical protein